MSNSKQWLRTPVYLAPPRKNNDLVRNDRTNERCCRFPRTENHGELNTQKKTQPSWYKICLQCRRPQFGSWVGKILWRRDRLPTPISLGFFCDSDSKESSHNAGDLGLIPGLGISPGAGKGYPRQYSGLEKSMDCIVLGVTKSRTQLRDFHFTFTKLNYQGQFQL